MDEVIIEILAELTRNQHVRGNNDQAMHNRDFGKVCPTFTRGVDRWSHFAKIVRGLYGDHPAEAMVAKRVLFRAIKGPATILVSSMEPSEGRYAVMNFLAYLEAVGQKFAPASESEQMKGEYAKRRQGKQEDVQSYLNEKHELFRLAYPNAGERAADLADFFDEATKGIANEGVRYSLWECRPETIEELVDKTIFLVAVERKRIEHGGSRTGGNSEGLTPVSRLLRPTTAPYEAMEVDHLQREDELDDHCECAAIQERGIRGPCYHCQKQGHMLRNCPRKSAGLPKIYPTKTPGKPEAKGGYGKTQARGQGYKGPQTQSQGQSGGGSSGYRNKFTKRVNHLDEDDGENQGGAGDESEGETEEAENEEVVFLEERYL